MMRKCLKPARAILAVAVLMIFASPKLARQRQDDEIQRRMQAQQAEIDRQQRELNQLKAQQAR
jgi:type II secretory pathway component PulM